MPGPLVSLHGRELGMELGTRRIAQRGRRFSAAISAAAGTANQTLVTFQFVDYDGKNVAKAAPLLIWLSDDATNGAGLTATTASGAVVAGASGVDFGDLTAKKAKFVQTDITGKYILAITDTAKTGFIPCVQMDDGHPVIGAAIATAAYG